MEQSGTSELEADEIAEHAFFADHDGFEGVDDGLADCFTSIGYHSSMKFISPVRTTRHSGIAVT